ncbi:helix-turn-helix transcriptional regulator [Bacteroides sp.]
MVKDSHCNRLTNCSQCSQAAEGILVHRVFPKGRHLPANKCAQNCMLFMLQGELLINSEEHPGTTLYKGQIILQAIGTKLELLALTDVEYIVYWFNEPPQICETYYQEILAGATMPLVYTPLQMNQRIANFMEDMSDYLDDQVACGPFIELKCKELMYLLTCYYPVPQLRNFFYPISSYTESFHYFVMQNYSKVKGVEDFAQLGGYTTTTFRRLFKNTYGVPVYEWILNKKREGILNDLQHTKQRITEISNRYGFDSLSHFAHFCKSSFGDSPRALRRRVARGEDIRKIDNTPQQ